MWKGFSVMSAKPDRNKRAQNRIYRWLVLLLIISWPGSGLALIDSGTEDDIRGRTLHITADKLVSDGSQNYIVFTGDVTAVYDDTTIHAEQLEVFYENTTEGAGRMAEENIQKIIASDRVTILFGDQTAECDRAVYTAADQTIVMTGETTRIQSGDDYISGKKITIDRNKGHIIVDSGPDQRVNAVFMPQSAGTTRSGTVEDHDDTDAE
jgi:lipopolysaccharide export system protein LptA